MADGVYITVGSPPNHCTSAEYRQIPKLYRPITNYPDADPAASPPASILYAKNAPDQMGLIKAAVRSRAVGVLSVL